MAGGGVGQVAERLRAALPDALAATVAAALSWGLCAGALRPAAPGLRRGRRDHLPRARACRTTAARPSGLVLGVTTGIARRRGGAPLLPDTFADAAAVSLASFVAIMIASGYGLLAVVPIQSGVSALLVLALGPEYAGIGPAARRRLRHRGRAALQPGAVHARPGAPAPRGRARRSLPRSAGRSPRPRRRWRPAIRRRRRRRCGRFSDAHGTVVALAGGIDNARSARTWSLRGRLVRRDVRLVAGRLERRSTRAYAAALLFGTALATAMQRRPGAAAGGAGARASPRAIRFCDLGAARWPAPHRCRSPGIADDWRRCLVRLDEAMEAIRELREAELTAEAAAGRSAEAGGLVCADVSGAQRLGAERRFEAGRAASRPRRPARRRRPGSPRRRRRPRFASVVQSAATFASNPASAAQASARAVTAWTSTPAVQASTWAWISSGVRCWATAGAARSRKARARRMGCLLSARPGL